MYDKDTVLSIFNKKGTLLQWLKHLESVVKDTALNTVQVNNVDNNKITLTFTFNDGASVTTPSFELPTANVTPSFEDVERLDLYNSDSVILSVDDGFEIDGFARVKVGDEIFEIPSKMTLALQGSESVVIDVNEDNNGIELHVDADLIAKLNRALLAPLSAQRDFVLVGIDTNGAQVFAKLGDGLTLDNGVIKCTATGGALYTHSVAIRGSRMGGGSADVHISCFSSRSTPFTSVNEFVTYFFTRPALLLHASYEEGPEFSISNVPVRVLFDMDEPYCTLIITDVNGSTPTSNVFLIALTEIADDIVALV